MDTVHLLPFLSTGITLLFTGAVFGRYFKRHRRPHLLLWGIGLALYATGANGCCPTACSATCSSPWARSSPPALARSLNSVLRIGCI